MLSFKFDFFESLFFKRHSPAALSGISLRWAAPVDLAWACGERQHSPGAAASPPLAARAPGNLRPSLDAPTAPASVRGRRARGKGAEKARGRAAGGHGRHGSASGGEQRHSRAEALPYVLVGN